MNHCLFRSSLHADVFGVRHKDRFIGVELELTVDYVRGLLLFSAELRRVLDLIGFKQSFEHLLEVPGDDEGAGGGDDTGLLHAADVEVVEARGREIDEIDPMLRQVLAVDLKLLRCWLVLAHWIFEATLAFAKLGRDQQEVRLRGGDHPLGIAAHIDTLDWVTETRQQRFRILTDLLVQPNAAVERANGETTFESRRDLVEHRIGLVKLLLRLLDLVVDTRVQSEDGPVTDANQLSTGVSLAVPDRSGQMIDFCEFLLSCSLELLHDFTSLQIVIEKLSCVIGVRKDESVLRIVQHHVHWMNVVSLIVFDSVNCEGVFDGVLVLDVIFVIRLVDLDDAARGDEAAIVSVCLQLAGVVLVFLVVGNDGLVGEAEAKRIQPLLFVFGGLFLRRIVLVLLLVFLDVGLWLDPAVIELGNVEVEELEVFDLLDALHVCILVLVADDLARNIHLILLVILFVKFDLHVGLEHYFSQ